jgi:hypothetical protein
MDVYINNVVMTNINRLYEQYDLIIKFSLFIVIIFEIYFLIGKVYELFF